MKKYCFIDTCVISEVIEKPSLRENFEELMKVYGYTPLLGDKVLSEIYKSQTMTDGFYDLSKELSFDVSNSSRIILQEEIDTYYTLEPISLSLVKLSYDIETTKKFVKLFVHACDSEFQKGAKSEIIESIVGLKSNYPPKNGRKYLHNEIVRFYRTIVFQQLSANANFDKSTLKSTDFQPTHFKSLISQSLVVFWKFYKMSDRRARDSDVFDISMAASFPYVDAIITEKNMANDLNMMKNENIFFKNIERVMTIKDLGGGR